MIASGTITVWRLERTDVDHSVWRRSIVGRCRVETSRGSAASNPQAVVSDSATAYVFSDIPLSEGDMVCEGSVGGSEPPSGALRVTGVSRWTLRGRFHHLEAHLR